MNNHKVIPFERNRYFYGKLLTVRDFEIEQRYFNDKRRLMNRLLVGPGILAGLNVLSVDDKTILVEPGVALDFQGREIVVETPHITRLSVVEGFDAIGDTGEIYLTLQYDEELREAVHNATSGSQSGSGSSNSEFNRFHEGYKLVLTPDLPNQEHMLSSMIQAKAYPLTNQDQLSVSITMGHNGALNEGFDVHLDIYKKKPCGSIRLDLILTSRFINYGQDMIMSFDESQVENADKYHLEWHYDISPVAPQDDLIAVKSYKLAADPLRTEFLDYSLEHIVSLGNESPAEMIEKKFRRLSLEDLLIASADDFICLAAIKVLKTDKTYVIESIEPDPLKQLLYNFQLTQILNRLSGQADFSGELLEEPGTLKTMPVARLAEAPGLTNTGKITFEFKKKANAREKFFSIETSHDLGPGEVFIELAVDSETREGDANFGYQNQMVFGHSDLFEKSNYEPVVPMLKMGAVLYKNKGTFIVGIQLLEHCVKDELTIRWKATKVQKMAKPLLNASGQAVIEPAMAKMKTRSQMSFNVFIDNRPVECTWRVKEENSGEIDNSGIYMSPSIEGVYEIEAEIPELHEVLSAYVVVENE